VVGFNLDFCYTRRRIFNGSSWSSLCLENGVNALTSDEVDEAILSVVNAHRMVTQLAKINDAVKCVEEGEQDECHCQ
jgi:hypothetical protein